MKLHKTKLFFLNTLSLNIFLLIINSSTYENKKNIEVQSADQLINSNIEKTNILDTNIIVIKKDDYIIKAETIFMKDSVLGSDTNVFSPICIDQYLIFTHNDTVLKRVRYPAKKIWQKTYNSQNVLMLENVIFNIGIINGKYGSLLAVNGYGGCNSCSEFLGLYSMKGDLLYESYVHLNQTITLVGNPQQTLKKYGIPDSIFLKGIYGTDIYPALPK